jgi:hypothetical protein
MYSTARYPARYRAPQHSTRRLRRVGVAGAAVLVVSTAFLIHHLDTAAAAPMPRISAMRATADAATAATPDESGAAAPTTVAPRTRPTLPHWTRSALPGWNPAKRGGSHHSSGDSSDNTAGSSGSGSTSGSDGTSSGDSSGSSGGSSSSGTNLVAPQINTSPGNVVKPNGPTSLSPRQGSSVVMLPVQCRQVSLAQLPAALASGGEDQVICVQGTTGAGSGYGTASRPTYGLPHASSGDSALPTLPSLPSMSPSDVGDCSSSASGIDTVPEQDSGSSSSGDSGDSGDSRRSGHSGDSMDSDSPAIIIGLPTSSGSLSTCGLPGGEPGASVGVSTGPAKTLKIWLTGYSYQDNTPRRSSIVSHPILHKQAGGTGTYADPITVASSGTKDDMAFKAGTRFYLPSVKRYVIVEDSGASKAPADDDGHLDMWVDGQGGSKSASDKCMDAITSTSAQAIENPPPNEPVMPGPITQNGQCNIPGGGTDSKSQS